MSYVFALHDRYLEYDLRNHAIGSKDLTSVVRSVTYDGMFNAAYGLIFENLQLITEAK